MARNRSRYLGPAREPGSPDGREPDPESIVLAQMRATLDGLLSRTTLSGGRRDAVQQLARSVDVASMHLANGRPAVTGQPTTEVVQAAEPGWLSRLGSDLEDMQGVEDVPDLLAHLARITIRELDADACMVSLIDRERGTLRDVAAGSRNDRRLNLVAKEYVLDDFPATRDMIGSGVPIQISRNDPHGDSAERAFLTELGFARVLLCPLVLAGETIGTIEIYRAADEAFEDDDWTKISSLVRFTSGPYSRIVMAERLRDHYTKTLEVLTSALEVRDVETHQHTGRMRELASALADAMRLSAEEKTSVRLGAMLHDVGKLGVPDSILLKPGSLTEEEWTIMRRHPEIGERMLSSFDFLAPALPVIRHHHERWDGGGYPDRLAGPDIPLAARIVAVCDALDAMTSDRPYRAAISIEQACDELVACSGSQFDPLCVAVLVNLVKDSDGRALDERSVVRYAS